jgi:hypothetical protein
MIRIIYKNFSWVVLGILVVAGLVASLYFSLQPRPIPKIRYSLFQSPKELGVALTQRLRLEIKQASVIFFGIDPSNLDQYQIVIGALELLRTEGEGIDVVVVDPNLTHKVEIPHQDEIELKLELERFSEGIKTAKGLKKRVAMVLPAIYASTLLENSPVSKYLANERGTGLVFTMSRFPTNQAEESDLIYPCVPHQEDRVGARNLGCMIVSKAKTLYRKKNPAPKRAGLVDQVGLSEYLVLFN